MGVIEWLALVLLGGTLGGLGGLFGIGGGVIAIPLLGLVFGMPQQLAQGTAMVMVVPNVLLGLWRNYQLGVLNRRYAFTLAAGAVVVTYFAALLALHLDARRLRLAFALFVLAIAVYLGWRTLVKPQAGPKPARLGAAWLALVGAAGGSISGLFGVGGALLVPPVLVRFFGLRQAGAQSHALAMVAPGTVVGLLTYAAHGQVDWRFGLPLAIGGAVSVSHGVWLAHRLPEKSLRLLFCGFLVGAAGLLATHS